MDVVKDCYNSISPENKKMGILTLHVIGAIAEKNNISSDFWSNAKVGKIHSSIESLSEEWKLLWFTLVGKVQS